ncbi:RNA polymerase sigma factor [Candidatus Peregrinibacteria bacterium]|nr:RNA polymerase sigma factor [Candidatus Peregrinibacteria bacterium]
MAYSDSPSASFDASGAASESSPTPLLTNEVLTQMVRTQTDFLLRVAFRFTHDRDAAEDLLQQTFLRAWKFRKTFREGDLSNMRNWLARILSNLAINDYRLEQGSPVRMVRPREYDAIGVAADESMVPVFSPRITRDILENFGALLLTLKHHVSNPVWNALNRLDPNFCHAFLLIDFFDYRGKEAAAILDIPVGTVMSRAHRARKRMRKALPDFAAENYGFIFCEETHRRASYRPRKPRQPLQESSEAAA